MKKIFLTLTGFFVTLLSIAQSPNLMNYQGVARNAAGNVLPNQSIALRLSIVTGTPAGATVYTETRTMLTNAFGLFNVVVGSPGATNVTGTIAGINWTAFGAGSGSKFLRVEIDPNGGSSFVNVGSTQLVSVPYSLYAGSAAPVGPAGGDLTGTYPNPQIFFPLIKTFNATTLTPANTQLLGLTNSATTGTLGAITGTSASNDGSATAIRGTMSSTSPGSFSSAVRGANSGTGGLGIGVWGSQAGSGYGVYGTTPNGWSVIGESTTGYGLWGTSSTGIGAYGSSNTNTAGFFENTNAANTASTLSAASNGSGTTVTGVNTGTGRGGFFQVNNPASTANALEATTNGIGASWAIRGNSTGTNGAGLFVQSNATNTANNVQSNQGGLGRAGLFQNTNTANDADALAGTTVTTGTTASGVKGAAGSSTISVIAKKGVWGESDAGVGVFGTSNTLNGVMGVTNTGAAGVAGFSFGTGVGVFGSSFAGRAAEFSLLAGNANTVETVTTAGTGTASNISNTNVANTSNVIFATNANINNGATSPVTGGGSVIFARKGAGLGTFLSNPTAIYASANDAPATSVGIAALTNANYGIAGISLTTGTAVLGMAIGTGTGVFALNTSTGYGLVTLGRVQIQGQGAGINRVLTSNNVGDATWNTLASVGGVSGTGTLNFMPKWTPDGTTIGNSQLFDNGTNIGLSTVSPNARFDIANAIATGRGGQIVNSSNANPNASLFVQTNNISNVANFFENSAFTGTLPLNVTSTMAAGATALKGIASSNAAVSMLSGIGVQGVSAAGYGVIGNSNDGVGLAGIGWGTGYGLYTFGRLQFEGQGAAANRVMTSTDANGNAVWNTLAGINGVSGNGTLNFVPKWSPDGTTLANSLAFDNGNTHMIGGTTAIPGDRLYVSNATGATWSTINMSGANAGGISFARNNLLANDIYMTTANDLRIYNYNSNTNALTILNSNGNVGINQINPTARLDVNGTFKLTDGSQGAGKVLTSDGSGVASWQGPASITVRLFSSNLTIPSGGYVPITQWANILNEDGGANYNNTTGEYTIPVTGFYQVNASILWDVIPTTATALALYVNGFLENSTYATSNGSLAHSNHLSQGRRYNAGDKLSFYVNQQSGVNRVLTAGYVGQTFSIELIHR